MSYATSGGPSRTVLDKTAPPSFYVSFKTFKQRMHTQLRTRGYTEDTQQQSTSTNSCVERARGYTNDDAREKNRPIGSFRPSARSSLPAPSPSTSCSGAMWRTVYFAGTNRGVGRSRQKTCTKLAVVTRVFPRVLKCNV